MKIFRINFYTLLLFLLFFLNSSSIAQLSGTKYIGGTSPDFITIEAAIDSLNAQGVGTGGVTFLIRNGIYNENDNLIILNVAATAANPVIFQPDAGATVEINITIIGDYNSAFKIHNSDYITFNGTPYGSTDTTRNMTINGIRNGSDEVFVFWIANGSDHCTLKNLIINSVSPTVNTGWSTPVYCSSYQVPSPSIGMDSFTLSNCEVVGGSTYGVFLDGETGIQLTNFEIINNNIHDFQKYGIHLLTDIGNCNIEGNKIYQTFTEARSSVYGIRAPSSSSVGTIKIHHNYIHNLKHSAMSGSRGIFITSNSHDNLIYDNMIYLIPGLTANSSYCIYMSSGDATNNQIYFNTLYMGGVDNRGTDSYCMRVHKDNSDNILKNNILINERTGFVGSNEHGALYIKTATSLAQSDYNFLTVNSDSVGDNRYVARVGSSFYNTLLDLQNVPGYAPRDQNSLTGDPHLNLPDLHLNSLSTCIDSGTTITGILTDFDYQLRDANPDIGADEYSSANQAPQIIYFLPTNTTLTIAQSTGQTFQVFAQDPNGDSLIYRWYLNDTLQGSDSSSYTHTFNNIGDDYVKAVVSDGSLADSVVWHVIVSLTNIGNGPLVPNTTQLFQNYPNPFNPTTKIDFDLSKSGNVKLTIYDILGREIRRLVNNEFRSAGRYTAYFTAQNLASGVYYYQLEVDDGKDYIMMKKMLLIK